MSRAALPPRTRRALRFQRMGAALLLALPLGAMTAGAALWQISGQSPAYRPLNAAVWQEAAGEDEGQKAPAEHPRRPMAYAAQDWLDAEHPTREEVEGRLGEADAQGLPAAQPGATAEAYRVGCGFTGGGCEAEDWLVVEYSAGGEVVGTSFQRLLLPPR